MTHPKISASVEILPETRSTEIILHRDVASPNVLLEPSGNNQWKGKLSDYGSANLQHQISTTVHPGNPAYAAPESCYLNDHSPAMDVYSFGVLLMEERSNQDHTMEPYKITDSNVETSTSQYTGTTVSLLVL